MLLALFSLLSWTFSYLNCTILSSLSQMLQHNSIFLPTSYYNFYPNRQQLLSTKPLCFSVTNKSFTKRATHGKSNPTYLVSQRNTPSYVTRQLTQLRQMQSPSSYFISLKTTQTISFDAMRNLMCR